MTKYSWVGFILLLNVSFASEAMSRDGDSSKNQTAKGESAVKISDESPIDSEEELLIVPVPSLIAVLIRLETEKGDSLTETEVLAARDSAASILMPRHAQQAVEKSRGYTDIDPENAWKEWLEYKANRKSPVESVRMSVIR